MTPQTFERKLTAILSADVAGYSRLMGEDEEFTIRTLAGHREMMSTLIEQHRGRVIDSPGDNLLAAFSSVTKAVDCAVEIQREMAERNEELPDDRKMEYRIGVNLGDVIEEGERIYGDGVNIAARLETLAEPGGIFISGIVYSQVKNRLKLEYEYLGKQTVKNISEPVPVYRVLSLPKTSAQTDIDEEQAYSLSDKPSIAVLPFANISGDPEQEYFADGMTEELIGALSKLEGLKVISRTSAFYFKGKDVKLRQVGEELKVDHVLEGSVRKAGNKLRISAQLIKVDDDTHLWSETYDRELEDVFAIQDKISQAVVENLKVKLLGRKTEPLVKDHTINTEAYDLFLKGKYFEGKGYSGWGKAIEFFEKAIKADPDFAPAYSKLGMSHYTYSIIFSTPPNEMWQKVKALALKALQIDEMDQDAHTALGKIKSSFEYDWQGAEIHFKRSVELNPGNSEAHIHYGAYLIGVGRTDEAIEKMEHALELDPFSINYNSMLSLPFYFARQYDKAIAQAQKTLELAPDEPMALVFLALEYATIGIYEESISILHKLGNIPLYTTILGYVYSKAGKREETQRILDDILERSKHEYFPPMLIGVVYGSLGDKDKAFEWLEKGFEDHDPTNWCIKVEPLLDNLRSDPRWKILMEKMGLAD